MIPKIQGFAGTPSRIREVKSGLKLPPEKHDSAATRRDPETTTVVHNDLDGSTIRFMHGMAG